MENRLKPARREPHAKGVISLTLKPCGRGHWHTFTMKLEGPLDMFTFRVKAGELFEFGSRKFWVVEVRP